MAPRTEKQYEEIRQEKKELILQTSLELFADKGYDNTSISQIAKKAGISKGLLYNYFESKEEVVITILNKGIDEVLKIFDPNHDGVLDPEELEFLIKENFRILKKKRSFWRLYYQVALQGSVFKYVSQKIDELYRPLMAMLIRYFKNMGFKNPETEVMIFSAILDGISLDYVMKPELIPLENIEKELIERYCKKNA
jgi:AcrR family transcriptional regulator